MKNHLFGKSADKIELVKKNWYEMTSALDDEAGVRFLRHYWVSKYGRIQATRLFRDIRDKAGSRSAVVSLSRNLKESAAIYSAFSNPEHEIWEDFQQETERIRDSFRVLNTLSAIQCYPVLLAAYDKLRRNHFVRLAHLMVVMAVRYSLICAHRTGALEVSYADLAQKIASGQVTTAATAFRELKDLYPSDSEFESSFKSREIRSSKHARFLLRELELQKSGTEMRPSLDPQTLNLEHIVPQAKNQFWKQIGKSNDDYDHWVYMIGNQVLLNTKKNKDLGGKSFTDKIAVFKESDLSLTSDVGRNTTWTEQKITERQEALAKLALKHWRYDV